MPIKILFLNFADPQIKTDNKDLFWYTGTFEQRHTLHDFHVIFLDMAEVLDLKWWTNSNGIITTRFQDGLSNFKQEIAEQLRTGGIIFCFASRRKSQRTSMHFDEEVYSYEGNMFLDNIFFFPVDLDLKNESGNTFYPKTEDLGYFSPLIKDIPKENVEWECYFSKTPPDAKILATSRSGYNISAEIPIGFGKFIVLPHYKNRNDAVKIIITKIIPQMVHEEELYLEPPWVNSFVSPFEAQARETLSNVVKVKRLLSTKEKLLEKAVALSFKIIGFKVIEVQEGIREEMKLQDGSELVKVDVKGHETSQVGREDISQFISHLPEDKKGVKGLIVSNHEFNKPPSERSKEAFTVGAIEVGENNKIALLSTIDLYNYTMSILQGKYSKEELNALRTKILEGIGIVHF